MLSQAHLFASSAAYSRSIYASADISKTSLTNGSKPDEPWENLAFPTYLQSEVDDFCQDWDEALQVPFQQMSTYFCSLILQQSHQTLVSESWQFSASIQQHMQLCCFSWRNGASLMLPTEMLPGSPGELSPETILYGRLSGVFQPWMTTHCVNHRKPMDTTCSGNMLSASIDYTASVMADTYSSCDTPIQLMHIALFIWSSERCSSSLQSAMCKCSVADS